MASVEEEEEVEMKKMGKKNGVSWCVLEMVVECRCWRRKNMKKNREGKKWMVSGHVQELGEEEKKGENVGKKGDGGGGLGNGGISGVVGESRMEIKTIRNDY